MASSSSQTSTSEPYTWTQTLPDVTVNVPIPQGTKGKDLIVKITKEHLTVKVKGETIIDGDFHQKVKASDSMWQIEDGKVLVLELQKVNDMEWWKSVIKGHTEIDTSKIEPENSKLSELDGETRGLVEKMMFDQRQKAQGLPTSDELQKQETLKKFMEDHPDFDFSNIKAPN
eukprot:TRINITY_DN728_c0_g1_i1.p1 TRINITY_DN728_c0_g1~~TRINITY_DN728_c0_g1_i1.p1  ORF type:complete len:172 (-),score=32.39 TRINITY_DN728_c0_g1_i1:142-657(-)